MTTVDGGKPDLPSEDMLHAVLAFYRLSRSLRNADLLRDLTLERLSTLSVVARREPVSISTGHVRRSSKAHKGDGTSEIEEGSMRFMVMVKATEESEQGILPEPEAFAAMQKYNEDLVKAGILLAAEGLTPSSKGVRVQFSGDKRTVVDGPFTESKEIIAGFSILQVKSMEEAIEWVKRAPNCSPNGEGEVEIRKLMDIEDFGEGFTPNEEVAKVKF